uniref:Uncharacterized protein n=1 Tax=Octopus bimaculoides TaxID=37653 RepID=A0A0L8G4T9_OCTBM
MEEDVENGLSIRQCRTVSVKCIQGSGSDAKLPDSPPYFTHKILSISRLFYIPHSGLEMENYYKVKCLNHRYTLSVS